MTENEARKLEVPTEWNGRANVCEPVAWMNTNGAFNHMKKAEQDALHAEAMGKLTEMVRAAQKPQPDRVVELEAETTKLKLDLLTSYGEAEELSGKVAELELFRQQLAAKDEVIAEAGEMLAMRDRQLAALKRELREICLVIDDPACDLTLTTVECIKKLKTENESLRKDAARLDWVEHQDFYDLSFAMLVDQPNDGMIAVSISEGWHLGNNLREAIDAAMIAGEQG